MMAAMMLPGAAPAVARAARAGGVRAVPLFAGSYLAVWALAGAVVFAAYRPHGTAAAGAVTIAAGVYELTPLKRRFRCRCRETAGSGLGFGLYCVGSSAGLMAMLVALGVMSVRRVPQPAGGTVAGPPAPAADRSTRVIAKMGIRWNLRRLMAEHDMFATTDLVPLLAERGIGLSREQVFRLVTQTPQRLSMDTLAALCEIFGCTPQRPDRGRGAAPAAAQDRGRHQRGTAAGAAHEDTPPRAVMPTRGEQRQQALTRVAEVVAGATGMAEPAVLTTCENAGCSGRVAGIAGG